MSRRSQTTLGFVAFLCAAASVVHAEVRSSDGWSWSNPLPQGNTLNSVWGSARDDVWAVGLFGTILHWDGTAWSASSSGTPNHLLGVWGSASTDVWAVGGGGTILHWDGTGWAAAASGGTSALCRGWGGASNDMGA